jgi:AcrR family transcriptional regulator
VDIDIGDDFHGGYFLIVSLVSNRYLNTDKIKLYLITVKIILAKRKNLLIMAPMPTKPGRKSPHPYHHGHLRDALIRAARKILEKDGLPDLSLRRVAQAAGVSSAAPYYHFADKKALLDAIAAEGFSSLKREMLARMEKEANPRARTQACGITYVAFALQNPALFRLMFGGNDFPSADAALAGPRQLTYDVLQQAVAAHSPGGKADPLTCLGLWALVHGIAKLILEGGIQPSEYGFENGLALAIRVLGQRVE